MFITERDLAGIGETTPVDWTTLIPPAYSPSVQVPVTTLPWTPPQVGLAQPDTVEINTYKPSKQPVKGYRWSRIRVIPSGTKQPDSYVWAVVPETVSDEVAKTAYAHLADRAVSPFMSMVSILPVTAPSVPSVTVPPAAPAAQKHPSKAAKYLIPAALAAAAAYFFL